MQRKRRLPKTKEDGGAPMKVCEEKLHDAMELVTNEDMEALEQEMKNVEPHTFSTEFEQKMEALLQSEMPKAKKKSRVIPRFAAAAAAVVIVAGGIGIASGRQLYASETKIPILQWMEDFFVTEHDTESSKGEKSKEVLFSQEQVGYLPEGFELVEEVVRTSKVSYTYENVEKDHIILEVWKDKESSGRDSEEISQDVSVNAAGLEYRYVYKTEAQEHIFAWIDVKGQEYYLSGSVSEEEMHQVMNGISY